MTIEDMKRDIHRRHPERVRVVFRTDPGEYPPAAVRKLRDAMGMSQATFAQVIGVSRILVQSWERGVRDPSALACRLLDTISAEPIGVAGTTEIRRAVAVAAPDETYSDFSSRKLLFLQSSAVLKIPGHEPPEQRPGQSR